MRQKITFFQPGRRAGRQATAQLVEATVLRMAMRLSDDAARRPETRPFHASHLTGAVALALSMDWIPEDRALQLQRACSQLLGYDALPDAASLARLQQAHVHRGPVAATLDLFRDATANTTTERSA